MGGSSFDLLMQELTKHQHIMDKLEEENRALRRQLADLRAGRGIVLEILGQRFTLAGEALTPSPAQATTVPTTSNPTQSTSAQAETKPSPAENAPVSPPKATTTPSSPVATPAPQEQRSTKAPAPQEQQSTKAPTSQEQQSTKAPTFLEEMMINEFETAMTTTPQAVWTGPVKKPELSDEEQKAALRRELKGSFLLE